MSDQNLLASVAARLFEPGAPPLLPCPELDKDGVRVFVAARHDVVSAVLSEEDTFSLRHYDDLLEEVVPGTRYLVGENDANRQVRLRQLHAAQGWLNARLPGVDPTVPPNLDPGFRDWIATLAREEATHVLDVLEHRARTGETINFVREYAFLLSWRMARRVIGVPVQGKTPALVHLILFFRNVFMPGPWLRLKDELGASLRTLFLLQPLFGQVFATITRSSGATRFASKLTATPALAEIDAAFDHPQSSPPDSLLRALVAVEPQFAGVADYRLQARSVLFELTGALVLIVGKVLSEVAAFAASPRGENAGIGWHALVARLRDPSLDRPMRDAIIAEMLRLTDTSQLVRTVRADCTWRGVSLRAGDRIVARVGEAAHDPEVFAEPHRFAPDPARPYITSGPLQGPHVCYGRGIAWTVIAEAIAATAGRIEPARDATLASFLFLPDHLPFTAIRS
ncbi:cytochrome P450 [Novosphingobium taihuense]|uniref:Cytochrome P450 n=1 Tax=Novosphingobium taihuense TaxID=260085 RepID=A0A7W7A8X6_9SPHN|nr:cytochrome P450 [Novosphingobium taihuense]MBB4611895.1 hypothetical protein [Novosphingobium taihuense]TWH88750.1 cytochrome P450 [Novosphingobium taihuense]